jgi:hypothetical protein
VEQATEKIAVGRLTGHSNCSEMKMTDMSQGELYQFYSGLVWMPYVLLMAYLFYEQLKFMRYPQYLIMFFLLAGCVLRCIWFTGYMYSDMIGYLTINRVAILCQFTALSLLIMMWARILKVTSVNTAVRAVQQQAPTKTPLPIDIEFPDGSDDLVSMATTSSAHSSTAFYSRNGFGSGNARAKNKKELTNSAGGLNSLSEPLQLWGRTNHLESEWERQSRIYFWGMVVANVLVWILILLSIILSTENYPELYAYNIMLISLLCLVETLIIMSVGLSTGLRITRDLSPVFLNDENQSRFHCPCRTLSLWCSILTLCCKQPASFDLHMQGKAVQKLLRISSLIAFFFLLRSIGFCCSAIYTELVPIFIVVL